MAWSAEQVELLKKLWADGESASQCVAPICRIGPPVSRNAVISKVHRLGLAGRPTTSRKQNNRKFNSSARRKSVFGRGNSGKRLSLPPIRPEPAACLEPDLIVPLCQRKTLAQLENDHCRWPFGDPREASFHFCGATRHPGSPYCEFHTKRAFVSPMVRERTAAWREKRIAAAPSFNSAEGARELVGDRETEPV